MFKKWQGFSRRTEFSGEKSSYTLFLLIGLLLFAFPLFWMITTSLKDLGDVHKLPMTWIPSPFKWANYAQVFSRCSARKLHLEYSQLHCHYGFFAVTLSSSLVAFGFARLRARGSVILFALVLSTMMIPPQVTMIPQYLLFNKFDWSILICR